MTTNKDFVQTDAAAWVDLRRRLSAYRGRLTPQRMAIYEAVVGRTTHPSVAAVHGEVRRRFPGISAATVYTTLDLFARLGLIQEIGGPVRRYDGRAGVHVNLVCHRCQGVTDVADAQLQALQRRAAARARGQVAAVRFELHGLCSRCRRHSRHRRENGHAGA